MSKRQTNLYSNKTDNQKQLDTPLKTHALILTESSMLFCFWCMDDLEFI